jgi:von Willebrand factor type A domain
VLDVSRSMAASGSPGSPTRLDRAKEVARLVRARVDDVPTGLATFTDRMLPHVLPTADAAAFEATLQKSIGIERPPARDRALQATTLGALAHAVQGRYFSRNARRRLLVVVTDGDTAPFDAAALSRALDAARIRLELVRVGDESERVYRPGGTPEPLYRPSPTAAETIDALAETADGVAVESGAEAGRAAADFLGRGPTTTEGGVIDVVSLAAVFAAAALLPLALLVFESAPQTAVTIRTRWRAATR